MEAYLLVLLLSVSLTSSLPPCPYLDSAGEHHFSPPSSSKTVHIHQPFWETASLMNWNQAQAFCNNTYNNATYSGGRLWEPATAAEYNAVRTEMVTVFPNTGPACRWWVGVQAPGTTSPKDAFYASSGAPLSWHTADNHHSGPCVTIDDDYDSWNAWDCDVYNHQWICESFTPQQEANCPTRDPCRNAFPDSSLDGFCSDVSWLGGDCIAWNSKGVPLCPFYENGLPVSIPGQICTCCKECLDTSCAAKGPDWSCVNYTTSLDYPQGSCVYDDSCTSPKDFLKEQCACCQGRETTTYTGTTETSTQTTPTQTTSAQTTSTQTTSTQTTSTQTTSTQTTSTLTTSPPEISCQDKGCKQSLEGQGACVPLHSADWAHLDNFYNLSVSAAPGLCTDIMSGSSDCCKCVMKKTCRDEGCKDHWQGQGICIKTSGEEFAGQVAMIDFSVGGRDDLCAGDSGCCTCFKKKTEKGQLPPCCQVKTVGGVSYQLVSYDWDMVQSLGCSDGCVYEDNQGNKFCFKPGKEEAYCNKL